MKKSDKIILACSKVFGVPVEQITHGDNGRETCDARKSAMFFIYNFCTMVKIVPVTEKETGKIFSSDHATVNAAKTQFKNLYKTDKRFRQKADQIVKELKIKSEFNLIS